MRPSPLLTPIGSGGVKEVIGDGGGEARRHEPDREVAVGVEAERRSVLVAQRVGVAMPDLGKAR